MGPSPAVAPEGRPARLCVGAAQTRRAFVWRQAGGLCAIIQLKMAAHRWLRSTFILSLFACAGVGSEEASNGSNRIHPVKLVVV